MSYVSFEHQLKHIESLNGPTVIVYQDLDVPSVGATVGDVMCNVYQASGAAGLITSGAARDVAQVRRATGSRCSRALRSARTRIVARLEVGQPVHVGGLEVRPGDLLHGDANGVTRIPAAIVSELPDVANEYARVERLVIDYAQSKTAKCVSEMLDRRRAMGEGIAALQRRVSSRFTTRSRN